MSTQIGMLQHLKSWSATLSLPTCTKWNTNIIGPNVLPRQFGPRSWRSIELILSRIGACCHQRPTQASPGFGTWARPSALPNK
eukprot:symbB.v1.2.027181.t1/scaffold2771.1/size70997/3